MRRFARRILLVVGVSVLFALPAAAQYDGDCKQCRQGEVSGTGTFLQYCGTAQSGTWGWERCAFITIGQIQACKGAGAGCYYLEVNG